MNNQHRTTQSTSPPVYYDHHAFVSYTTREEEVKLIKPFIDNFVDRLKRSGVTVCPVFYDGWYLERRKYQPAELADLLRSGIDSSAFTISFLSPGYIESEWCRLEWWSTLQCHRSRDEPALDHSIFPILWKRLPTGYWWGRARRQMLSVVRERLSWKGYGYIVPPKGEAVDISDLKDPWRAPLAMWTCMRATLGYLERWYPRTEWRSAGRFKELV